MADLKLYLPKAVEGEEFLRLLPPLNDALVKRPTLFRPLQLICAACCSLMSRVTCLRTLTGALLLAGAWCYYGVATMTAAQPPQYCTTMQSLHKDLQPGQPRQQEGD